MFKMKVSGLFKNQPILIFSLFLSILSIRVQPQGLEVLEWSGRHSTSSLNRGFFIAAQEGLMNLQTIIVIVVAVGILIGSVFLIRYVEGPAEDETGKTTKGK